MTIHCLNWTSLRSLPRVPRCVYVEVGGGGGGGGIILNSQTPTPKAPYNFCCEGSGNPDYLERGWLQNTKTTLGACMFIYKFNSLAWSGPRRYFYLKALLLLESDCAQVLVCVCM